MPLVTFADEEVTFHGDLVTFGEESEAPTPSGTAPLEVLWDGVEIGGIEWNANGREILGGIGSATITAQDRNVDSTWEPRAHHDVKIRIRATGWVLFHGESLQPRLELPPGMPWRRWVVPCRDYNAQLAERLVGAPAGSIFQGDPNDPDLHYPVDPSAVSASTDEVTIQEWYTDYFLLPDGTPVDTATYVFEYVPNGILGDPRFAIDEQDGMTTLAGMIAALAALADVNVQDWLDPDDNHHHQAIPAWEALIGEDPPADLDAAPFELWDRVYEPDGETAIGHGGITVELDGQTMPEVVYVQGKTTFVYNGGDVTTGGSGWYPDPPNRMQRQAYLAVPDAWDQSRRDIVAAAALERAGSEILRTVVKVVGWLDPATGQLESRDGWRCGQLLTIRDPRKPYRMRLAERFVIQEVAWRQLEGTEVFVYDLAIGDGPPQRSSERRVNDIPTGEKAKPPMFRWVPVDAEDLPDIVAGSVVELVFTPNDRFDETVYPVGMPVTFRVVAYDEDENVVPDQGSCDPASTTLDTDGRARTTFTAGDIEDLDYEIFAETELPV